MFKPVVSIEPITETEVRSIGRALGSIPAMVCRIGEADASKGAGVIDRYTKCLWTKDRKRIEINVQHGSVIASVSHEIDPDCPI